MRGGGGKGEKRESKMWSPREEHLPRRAGRTMESDLALRYLSPGAFTLLPPKVPSSPDPPPSASREHRQLTPNSRRHRNASFAIIADLESNNGSRSPSPTGRVSPFRGRGFNPAGSRHASPLPSPPPESRTDHHSTTTKTAKRSKIPTALSRQGSSVHLTRESNLSKQTSQSLTNISPRNVPNKPPASPRKATTTSIRPPRTRVAVFQKLSPIIGSSPEPSPQVSSPSKIPRSKSQPPRNLHDPSSPSSREGSPSRLSQTKINYRNVRAKVNSFTAVKPKVPPKPQVPKTNDKPNLERKDSVLKTNNNSIRSNNKISVISDNATSTNSKISKSVQPKQVEEDVKKEEPKKNPSLLDMISPSTTAVVSSTTTTVTQPLKIDTKFDVSSSDDSDKVYMPDARALSATSVSTAMNRMNDTVLDTKTIIKDTNMPKLSPNTAVSTSNDQNQSSTTTMMSKPVTNGKKIAHEQTVGLTDALPKSANERIKTARTMVAGDVQPLRIVVKEKPSDAEVQSGNVRFTSSVTTNGIAERPGLPPPTPPPPEEVLTTPEPSKDSSGGCGRFFRRFEKTPRTKVEHVDEKKSINRLICCCRRAPKQETPNEEKRIDSATNLLKDEKRKAKWWHPTKCCGRNKVGDRTSREERKSSWGERTESSFTGSTKKRSAKNACKNFFRTLFCLNLCSSGKRKREEEEAMRRRASIMSKKKSLTPPTVVEEPKSKLDAGLVEHTSLMKGAIPVLPVPLAWLCLIVNVFLPGIGTIVSGFLCLCLGKARFSTNDGMKQRMGACIIDFFIGCGQLFTVLFCLVGWGWSIWWGVIMIKTAKKYRKIRRAEKAMEEENLTSSVKEDKSKDPEQGS